MIPSPHWNDFCVTLKLVCLWQCPCPEMPLWMGTLMCQLWGSHWSSQWLVEHAGAEYNAVCFSCSALYFHYRLGQAWSQSAVGAFLRTEKINVVLSLPTRQSIIWKTKLISLQCCCVSGALRRWGIFLFGAHLCMCPQYILLVAWGVTAV